jgi:hypothetical protein
MAEVVKYPISPATRQEKGEIARYAQRRVPFLQCGTHESLFRKGRAGKKRS